MNAYLSFFVVCFSSHRIPVHVFPTYSGLDKIGLKDYEQLECMPLLKNYVNAYPLMCFVEITMFESVYEGMCECCFCFLCAKRQKRDSMNARTFYSVH